MATDKLKSENEQKTENSKIHHDSVSKKSENSAEKAKNLDNQKKNNKV